MSVVLIVIGGSALFTVNIIVVFAGLYWSFPSNVAVIVWFPAGCVSISRCPVPAMVVMLYVSLFMLMAMLPSIGIMAVSVAF